MTDSFDQGESLPSKSNCLEISGSDPASQPLCQGAVALGEEPRASALGRNKTAPAI